MDNRPLKIAILSPYLPPIYSGAGRQALRIAKELKSKGISVFFVTCRYPELNRRSSIGGIRIYDLKVKNILKFRGHIEFGLKALGILIRQRNHFDILFSPGMGKTIGFLFLVMRLLKKKVITRMSLFTDVPINLKKRKLGPYLLLPYHLSHRIIAPSTARQKDVILAFPEKEGRVVRINNCVDIEKFKPCDNKDEKIALIKSLNLDPELRYVSYVGRIIARKGLEFLVEAWKEVIKNYDKAVLLLIGPKDYISKGEQKLNEVFFYKIKKEIQNNGMGNKVLFVGETNRVAEYLKISDIVVFASTAEGLPSAPIEAMAAGVPPVVLNIKDIMTDIIDSGQNGVIVPPEDLSGFSEALLRLLRDDKYRLELSGGARKKAVEHFSIEVVSRKYIELFECLKTNASKA